MTDRKQSTCSPFFEDTELQRFVHRATAEAAQVHGDPRVTDAAEFGVDLGPHFRNHKCFDAVGRDFDAGQFPVMPNAEFTNTQ